MQSIMQVYLMCLIFFNKEFVVINILFVVLVCYILFVQRLWMAPANTGTL